MVTTFYIFHGDDDLGIDEAVSKLRAEMGDSTEAEMNISEFDGSSTSPAEVLNSVSSFPFLASKRMAIVRGMLGWLTRKGAGQTGKDGIARLESDLPNLPDYARLIFMERQSLPDKHKILKLATASDRGYVRKFSAPKDMTNWIIKRSQGEYETRIDNRAALALAAVIGDDLRRADNELIKLASYVEPGEPITEDDVAALTPYVPEANIFKMVDAIAEGRGRHALDLMHRLMADKKQDAFSLFGMIVRQFRLLLLAKEAQGSSLSRAQTAKALGVRDFVVDNLARQSRAFSIDDLERIYRSLHEADFKMKTGQITPELALDLFVAGLSR